MCELISTCIDWTNVLAWIVYAGCSVSIHHPVRPRLVTIVSMFRGAVVIYTRLHVVFLCVQSWHGDTILANVLHISIGMLASAYVWTRILVIYYHVIVETVNILCGCAQYMLWVYINVGTYLHARVVIGI